MWVKVGWSIARGWVGLIVVGCGAFLSSNCGLRPDAIQQRAQIDRQFAVCPADLADDVVQTLGLDQTAELTLDEIKSIAVQRGFDYAAHRYGVSPPNQCQDLKELSPNTTVLRVRAGWDSSGDFARSFVVVVDNSDRVTHIEARYTYEPPSL